MHAVNENQVPTMSWTIPTMIEMNKNAYCLQIQEKQECKNFAKSTNMIEIAGYIWQFERAKNFEICTMVMHSVWTMQS